MTRVMTLLLTACLMIGCGFHLRGLGEAGTLPPQLQVLYIESKNAYGPLTQDLKQMLQGMGAKVTAAAQESPARFVILRDEMGQQTTGMSTTSQLSTYTLTYTVSYQIVDAAGKVLLLPRHATATRSFTQNSNQMLSSNYEYMQLEQDMRRDVVAQIMYQLGSKNTAQLLARSK